MIDDVEFMNFYLPLILKIIKIGLYLFGTCYFLNQARKGEGDRRFQVFLSLFFLGLGIGTTIEVVTQTFFPEFYSGVTYLVIPHLSGEVFVYFSGFIGIALLTLGTELKLELRTKGLLAGIAFLLAAITLFIGMGIANYIYFLGLVIVIVPIVYFRIAFKAEQEVRRKAFMVAFGFFIVLLAEGNNYNLIQRVFPLNQLAAYFETLIGYSVAFLAPSLIIIGLLVLYKGYKIF